MTERRFEVDVALVVMGQEDRYASIPLIVREGRATPPLPQIVEDTLSRLWSEATRLDADCELTLRIRRL